VKQTKIIRNGALLAVMFAMFFAGRAPEAEQVRTDTGVDLASDLFIVYTTWEWLEQQNKTGNAPVYAYVFERTPPVAPDTKANGVSPKELGARHACEIEYVFGALKSQPNPWEAADFKISDAMASYWANFTKTGNPNGPELENWPAYTSAEHFPMMHFGEKIAAAPQAHRERYMFWSAGA
jgi:para-nitrobenzyl esterase